MRYVILLLMLCLLSACRRETNSTVSLQEFSEQIRQHYAKKDWDWIQQHEDTNGMPAELVLAQWQERKEIHGSGNMEVKSVETLRFSDYTPKRPLPGEFQGRKLRYVGKPTHWIILKTMTTVNLGGSLTNYATQVDFRIPVLQKDGNWTIAGETYAD
jgi:hypothetical protein